MEHSSEYNRGSWGFIAEGQGEASTDGKLLMGTGLGVQVGAFLLNWAREAKDCRLRLRPGKKGAQRGLTKCGPGWSTCGISAKERQLLKCILLQGSP